MEIHDIVDIFARILSFCRFVVLIKGCYTIRVFLIGIPFVYIDKREDVSMLNYFRSYEIIVCVVGVGIPIVVSTVWAYTTGEIMASSIMGLILLILLLLVSLFVMQFIMGKVADGKINKYISYYDNDCDPQKMLDESAKVRERLVAPFNTVAAWFAAYCAQALLDVGHTQQAQTIAKDIRSSVDSQNKTTRKVDVLMNLVPLLAKLEGATSARDCSQYALNLLDEINEPQKSNRRAYLQNQFNMAQERIDNNNDALISLYESTRNNKYLAMRIRVEYAWDEARIFYSDGSKDRELSCLHFVVDNGNKLALVSAARKRLAELS